MYAFLKRARATCTVLVGQVMVAAPPGMSSAGPRMIDEVKSLIATAGTIFGILVLAVSGGLASWKASKQEDWLTPVVCGLIGTAIAAICF